MKSGASVRVWHSKKCQLTASREESRKEWETIHKTQKKEREEQWAHLDITIWGRYEDELRWRSTRDTLAILAPLQLYFKTKPSSECVCACVWLIKRNSTARMNAVLRQFHFSSIKMVVVIEPRMMPTTQSYSWTKADQDRIRSAINQFEEWLVSSSNSCSSGHLRHYTSIASSPSSVGQRKEGRESIIRNNYSECFSSSSSTLQTPTSHQLPVTKRPSVSVHCNDSARLSPLH